MGRSVGGGRTPAACARPGGVRPSVPRAWLPVGMREHDAILQLRIRRSPTLVTRPGAWRPVPARAPIGARPRRSDTHRQPATAVADDARSSRADATVPRARSTCIFCHRPSGTVTYAWPDWLCRFLAERQERLERRTRHAPCRSRDGRTRREARPTRPSPACAARAATAGCSASKTTCSPFLESMIARRVDSHFRLRARKLLARGPPRPRCSWSAADRTRRSARRSFAIEHLRKVGVHAGTQVLVGTIRRASASC